MKSTFFAASVTICTMFAVTISGCGKGTTTNISSTPKTIKLEVIDTNLKVTQGETQTLRIKIEREGKYKGTVDLAFELPSGVTKEGKTAIPYGTDEAAFTLKAGADAPLDKGTHKIKIIASGTSEVKKNAEEYFNLIVLESAENKKKRHKKTADKMHAKITKCTKEICDTEERMGEAPVKFKEAFHKKLSGLNGQVLKAAAELTTFRELGVNEWEDQTSELRTTVEGLEAAVQEAAGALQKQLSANKS